MPPPPPALATIYRLPAAPVPDDPLLHIVGQYLRCYRPPTKLREGNVFTGICILMGRGSSHVTITHDALASLYRPLTLSHQHQNWDIPPFSDIRLGTYHLATDIWQQTLETCLNLFTWGPPGVTSGGVCQSTYGLQAGGTHPTGMLSC